MPSSQLYWPMVWTSCRSTAGWPRVSPQAHAGPSHQGGPGGAAEVWGCQVYMRVEVRRRESTGSLLPSFTELLFSTSLVLRFFFWTEVTLLTSSTSEVLPLITKPHYIWKPLDLNIDCLLWHPILSSGSWPLILPPPFSVFPLLNVAACKFSATVQTYM